ncbi:MAG: class I mannose-6-phosphate isomerase [Chloroflexota bacterium]
MADDTLGPWRLEPNRVQRFYRGGALLERFRSGGAASGDDADRPEDWVGSATRAWTPPGTPPTSDGLSVVRVGGLERRIADLLADDPDAIAGAPLVAAAGASTGLLVKLLDAAVRLPVHAHPSRAFARRHLGSFFGKAEAWLVIDTRQIAGEQPPGVRLAFRHDIAPTELRRLVEDERTEAILDAMHHRPTAPGDVWFIPPGLPHAIGAGVFMVEIEEPSDFSVVIETRDVPIDPINASLGLGWDDAIESLDVRGWSDADVDALRHEPVDIASMPELDHVGLTAAAADPYFRAQRLTVRRTATPWRENAFLVGVVTDGAGSAAVGDTRIDVRAGDTFAVPAASLRALELSGAPTLGLIACLPPRADDLAAVPEER